MKVKIGPYGNYYTLHKMLMWIEKLIGEEKYDKYFYETKWFKYISNSSLFDFINKITDKRKVSIKIHNYDVWSADHTLALIIHPTLVKLKETKHGAPHVEDEDVPDELKSTSVPKSEKYGDVDENFFKRWDYVLDEMIWAFNEIIEDTWEDQYHSGEIDWVSVPIDDHGNVVSKNDATFFRMENGPNHTRVVDMDGIKAHRQKIQNGLRLFAKYYFSLWD